ncbi:hypothetical protein Xths_15635 [Xanthomonas campestris pv. thespesiae]|nr:hypothetical protein Xths_15635 [Xanthomonas campestris pv. thespesiae]
MLATPALSAEKAGEGDAVQAMPWPCACSPCPAAAPRCMTQRPLTRLAAVGSLPIERQQRLG